MHVGTNFDWFTFGYLLKPYRSVTVLDNKLIAHPYP